MKKLLFAFIYLLFIACGSERKVEDKFSDAASFLSDSLITLAADATSFRDSIELPLEDGLSFIPTSLLVESVTYVPLETNKDCLIQGVEQSLLYKDRIYILDNLGKSVLMFAKDGSFMRRIGQYGRGPNEYINPINITIDSRKDELYVYDDSASKYLIYDLEGELLREQRVTIRLNDMLIANDGRFIINTDVRTNFHLPEIANNKLVIADSSMTIFAKGHEYNATKAGGIALSRKALHEFNEEIYFNPSLSYYIYEVNQNSLQPVYFIDAGKYSLPQGFESDLDGSDFYAKYDGPNSQYAYIGRPIFQDNNILTTSIRFKGQYHFLFYSKNSKSVLFGNAVEVLQDRFVVLTNINGKSDDGEFYGFIQPYRFIEQRDQFFKSRHAEIKEPLMSIAEDDNPIVALYTFNNF